MKRRRFIYTSIAGSLGSGSLSSFIAPLNYSNSNLKISITPWSLMRKGYGDDDPLGIDVFDYPTVAKSLGFNYIDHEMFHFPPNLNEKHLATMNANMKTAGVKSGVFLTGGVGDISDKNLAKRKKALDTYKYWVDIACELGCKSMRNVCGENITIPYNEKLNYAIEGLSELGDYAATKNIT